MAVYLLKILAHPRLTPEQKKTGEKFKAILLSMNLQSMRLNAADTKPSDENEVRLTYSIFKLEQAIGNSFIVPT